MPADSAVMIVVPHRVGQLAARGRLLVRTVARHENQGQGRRASGLADVVGLDPGAEAVGGEPVRRPPSGMTSHGNQFASKTRVARRRGTTNAPSPQATATTLAHPERPVRADLALRRTVVGS